MVTKRQIAEVVLNRLNGGKINRDSKITIRQAMWAVGEARNFTIAQRLSNSKREFGTWDVPFDILSEYSEEPKYDESKCQWYVDMPVDVLALHQGMGVYSVFQKGFEQRGFVPQEVGAVSLYDGLEAQTMQGRKSYYPMDKKLWLFNTDYDTDCDVSLILRLIANSHSIGDREDFRLDGDMEVQVTELAFQKLAAQVQFPSDDLLNNISTK
jgi:hypothetical protein